MIDPYWSKDIGALEKYADGIYAEYLKDPGVYAVRSYLYDRYIFPYPGMKSQIYGLMDDQGRVFPEDDMPFSAKEYAKMQKQLQIITHLTRMRTVTAMLHPGNVNHPYHHDSSRYRLLDMFDNMIVLDDRIVPESCTSTHYEHASLETKLSVTVRTVVYKKAVSLILDDPGRSFSVYTRLIFKITFGTEALKVYYGLLPKNCKYYTCKWYFREKNGVYTFWDNELEEREKKIRNAVNLISYKR